MELCLPEDLVTEILTRIPAYHLLKLRRVCRKWKDLISTQYFHNTHLIKSKEQQRHSSMIIISHRDKDRDDDGGLALVDKWDQPAENRPIFLRGIPFFKYELGFNKTDHQILYSCDGLIVIYKVFNTMNICEYFIHNPITRETVTVKCLNRKFKVLASFYSPWVKEYCLLLERGQPDFRFEILSMGCQPLGLKALKRPNVLQNTSSWFAYGPPLVIDNANIYWKLNSMSCKQMIMAFNIKTEEFSFLAHPLPHSTNDYCLTIKHRNMDIVNIHGNLSFVHIECNIVDCVVFNIWTLKDPADQQQQQLPWIKIHRIIINLGEFDVVTRWLVGILSNILTVMALENGELFVQHFTKRVYAYNIESGTIRMIWVSDNFLSKICGYVPSFARLRNYESVIWI